MKNSILILLLFLTCSTAFSQDFPNPSEQRSDSVRTTINEFKFEYNGRFSAAVKKEELVTAETIADISPGLWDRIGLQSEDKEELERRKNSDYSQLYTIYPGQYDYKRIIDYVSVSISAFCNGRLETAETNSDKLSEAQKQLLNASDLGSDISFDVKFKYKYAGTENSKSENEVKQGFAMIAVVPATEAEYPGGFKELSRYLTEKIFNKIPVLTSNGNVKRAVVNFTINESGHVVDVRLRNSSGDADTDKIILNAFNAMPLWTPAKNAAGKKVKQQFNIPFGGDGC